MTRDEIMKELIEIFQDEFDDESLKIDEEMILDDLEDFSSLSMVNLMSTIAAEFSINFSMGELRKIQSVGDIVELILGRK
ncbi:acyl carrier protein [Lachnospiraceae bacterium WCA-9-b2]|jgi:Acyl carrier protein|uniref:Acyl carrier protein n=1 Tax=Sporofaciens musculi TaxID=2681861 RepID=A0A7X3SII7_9FIRM|nr:acyl carrier protein [Sporofaciens musculi]MXP75583.1 acyl carrier protein [Sporofaciens musculi]